MNTSLFLLAAIFVVTEAGDVFPGRMQRRMVPCDSNSVTRCLAPLEQFGNLVNDLSVADVEAFEDLDYVCGQLHSARDCVVNVQESCDQENEYALVMRETVEGVFHHLCSEESRDGTTNTWRFSTNESTSVSGNLQEVKLILLKISKYVKQLSNALPDVVGGAVTSSGGAGGGASGSVFVRWGHSACPGTAEMVYTGFMAGSHYSTSGGAANILCLSPNPKFSSELRPPVYGKAALYGVEYESHPNPTHDQDGLCSVCLVSGRASVMVPATNECPDGWNLEYDGYLMAGKPNIGRVSTEYICVDTAMEGRQGSNRDENDGVIYFTEFKCGRGLACPPYETRRLALCAVCSK